MNRLWEPLPQQDFATAHCHTLSNNSFRGGRPVRLFTRDKKRAVQSFILNVVNNNCPELAALTEGPRLENRVNLTLPVLVVPVEDDQPLAKKAFTALTKEFSTSGLALVLDRPRGLDEAILGFRWDREMTFIRARAKHLNPIGGGFFQLGLQMTEVVHPSDVPDLESMQL